MFLRFDENPNTGFVDDRVFQERTEARQVSHVLRRRAGQEVWCPVTGLEDGGRPVPALARKVEDSGEGMCYLVYGGRWGMRLKDPACADPWSLKDAHQWGEPFLLLPSDGADLRFT
jgi:hypothetical protein